MNQPVGEKRTQTQPERIKKRDKDIFVENFNFVQRAPLSTTAHRQKAGVLSSIHSQATRRHGRIAQWRRGLIRGPRDGTARNIAGNERPVRGDNRTGQAIWALGVDGRSRRIQPRWGGITAPTLIRRGRGAGRSTRRAIFLTFRQELSVRFRAPDEKLLRGGPIGLAGDRLVGRPGGGPLAALPWGR